VRVVEWIRRAREVADAERKRGRWRVAYLLRGVAGYLEGGIEYGVIDPNGEIGRELRRLVV